MNNILFFLLMVASVKSDRSDSWDLIGSPLVSGYPCEDKDIVTWFDPGLPAREKNRYYVVVNKTFPEGSILTLSFDTDVYILYPTAPDYTKYSKEFLEDTMELNIKFVNGSASFGFIVKGGVLGTSPYFSSLAINNQEFCNRPNVGYFEEIIFLSHTFNKNCGMRKIKHTELIVNGADTKRGDWPWHAAIYTVKNSAMSYMCGGTLISKNFVLTAAHCATIRGIPVNPRSLIVALGRYDLISEEQDTQQKNVHKVIIHGKFHHRTLDNDICLLKLKTEVIFTDYVQPACLYSGNVKDHPFKVFGTAVGWGFDSTDALSHQLKQAKMPIVPDTKCIKSEPIFYGELLNNNKFCAGYHNGTSVCNGDSGSGFHVFVPDTGVTRNVGENSGLWYVRGIVSMTLSRKSQPICDSTQYAVFTDVRKYRTWIDSYLENEH